MVLALVIFQTQPASQVQVARQSAPETSVSDMPLLHAAAETPWEATFDTQALLAMDDTSQLTDSEIGFLLY